MLSTAMALCGCADLHLRSPIATNDHLEFLSHVLAAEDKERETMWRSLPPAGLSKDAALQRALLQSVPGHSGYNPATAESTLQSLVDEKPPRDIEGVARLRLAELKTELRSASECKQENTQLRQRLARVVDIERKLNSNGH